MDSNKIPCKTECIEEDLNEFMENNEHDKTDDVQESSDEASSKFSSQHSIESIDCTDNRKSKSKTKVQKTTKLSGYNKRRIIDFLNKDGYTLKNFKKALSTFKADEKETRKFFNKHQQLAQQYVHQECDSISFKNIEAWLKLFEAKELFDLSFFEPSVVMNAISNNETHPDESELGGIDIKAAYKFLAYSMKGLPPPKLNEVTKQFVAYEFLMLIEDANSPQADIGTKSLIGLLQNIKPTDHKYIREKLSLDPLWLQESL